MHRVELPEGPARRGDYKQQEQQTTEKTTVAHSPNTHYLEKHAVQDIQSGSIYTNA